MADQKLTLPERIDAAYDSHDRALAELLNIIGPVAHCETCGTVVNMTDRKCDCTNGQQDLAAFDERAFAHLAEQSAIIDGLNKRLAEARSTAFRDLEAWCQRTRAEIGAIDGYDYRSGQEYGLRLAEICCANFITQPDRSAERQAVSEGDGEPGGSGTSSDIRSGAGGPGQTITEPNRIDPAAGAMRVSGAHK